MALQAFMWTALPNGVAADGKSPRVSVLLSPRLDAQADAEQLSSFFPDWEDWPATLAKATFEIRYGGDGVKIPATQTTDPNRVDTTLGTAESVVWKALFHGDLHVKGFEYKDLSDHQVLSYETTQVAAMVRILYGKLAAKANGQLPNVSDFVEDPKWKSLIDSVATIDRRFTNEDSGLRDSARQFELFKQNKLALGSPQTDLLARMQLFHTPPGKPKTVKLPRKNDPRIEASWVEQERHVLPDKQELAKKLDFHQIVAAMNSYPTLLRRLGIVVDFIIDPSAFPATTDAALSIAVHFPAHTLKVRRSRDTSPITHASLSINGLRAVSDPLLGSGSLRVKDGLLDLNPKQFAILQADVDGAGLKLMNFARSLGRFEPGDERVDSVTRMEKELGTPSLRTAGFVLVHRGRGGTLEERFAANKTKNDKAEAIFQAPPNSNPPPPELWAEDLVRGFRFDVWDGTTEVWRSLCRRKAVYELNDGAVVVTPINEEEEGTLRMGATTSSDKSSNQDIVYLHESIVSWTGWSLAAPPPGRAIMPNDKVDTTVATTDAELPPGLKFRSRFQAVPGSLPRLRFGRRYWLRARIVDLAGNSLPVKEGNFGSEDPTERAQPFLRWEPVAAPAIALVKRQDGTTERPAEGESMLRMAIRSRNDTPPDNSIATLEVARRFAVPPQVSAKEAEHHGKLDSAGKVDSATFNLLANQKDLDANDPNAALILEKIPTQGPLDPAPVDTVFAVYREGRSLTYLPDALAEEVAVRIFGHQGIADTQIITVPLYPSTAWPEAAPFKIEIREVLASPQFDLSTRTLLVPLAKGHRATVRLSMRLSKQMLREVMGIWRWVPGAQQQALESLALSGQHWMLTPWRSIEIVHAVQRPLIAPEIVKLLIGRGQNDTSAQPGFVATCSLKSTDRVDLLAEWHEPSDDPAVGPIAIDQARGDVAFAVKITEPSTYATKLDGHARGGFPEHTIPSDDHIGVGLPLHDLVTPKRHEFHDTRYRRVEYWLEGTTKFREYMPPEILLEDQAGTPTPTEKNIKIVGPRTVTWIPSSASPLSPAVLYVVPTFGWNRLRDANGNASSWRRGGGLRVYLNRPWNVTGYGEMLAVVLPPSTFSGDPDSQPNGSPYKQYVTQWGNDPIWLSPFVGGIAPKRSSFPLARTSADPTGTWLPKGAPATESDQPLGPFPVTGLLPSSAPNLSGNNAVEIAPHDVFYDEERRLWYCDIEIEQGATYWPFVRLALARYQPVSVSGTHLSDIVLADFMPLTADRWLNVNRVERTTRRRVTVFGYAPSDSSGRLEASKSPSMSLINRLTNTVTELTPAKPSGQTVFEVWVEQLDASRGEDFGWVRVTTATIQPASLLAAGLEANPSARFVPVDQIARGLEFQKSRHFEQLVSEKLVDKIFAFLTLWDGEVALPAQSAPGSRFRLVIAEFEEYLVDDDRPYDKVPTKMSRRMVFVEHVELT